MPTTKKSTTIRLTEEARELRRRLSIKCGISLSAVMEQSIRLMAEREGVRDVPPVVSTKAPRARSPRKKAA